jgi:lysozyme
VRELALQLLNEEEGRVPHAYQDHLGYWTIGVGHLIDERKGGRLPDQIINELLAYDIDEKTAQAQTLPGWEKLNEVQRAVLVSMVFQIGIDGVRGFRNMLAALAAGDLSKAAAHGRASKWARQDTPRRADRQMKMLQSGVWVPR